MSDLPSHRYVFQFQLVPPSDGTVVRDLSACRSEKGVFRAEWPSGEISAITAVRLVDTQTAEVLAHFGLSCYLISDKESGFWEAWEEGALWQLRHTRIADFLSGEPLFPPVEFIFEHETGVMYTEADVDL